LVNTIVKKVTVGVPIKGVTSGAFAITNLGGVDLTSVGNGDILVYNASTSKFLADSDTYIKSTDSAEIKSMFSAGGDLSYDSAAGQFSINVDSFASAISAVSFGDGSASAPSITNTDDSDTGLHFPSANTMAFSAGGTSQFTMTDGVIAPVTDNDVDLGTSSLEFKDAYFDGTVHTDAINLDGTAITSTAAEINLLDTAVANTVVNSKAVIYGSGGQLAGTLSTAAQANVTSLGTLTALTIDDVVINGATIGHSSDTDLITVASGVMTVAGEVDALSLDISGNADIDGTLEADAISIDGTTITATAAELNALDGINSTVTELNIVDGDTSATSTTVADADRVVFNDGGTMKQVAVTDLAAYFDDEITAMPNLVTTAATTVGALNSGSITSGFGAIDNGASNITTTGIVAAGRLQADNIRIDGNAITATSGTDLTITPVAGQQIVLDGTIEIDAGVVTGATSITSTAFVGGLTGNVTGNVSGTALTVTQAAQSAITSLGTLTTLTVDDIIINGGTIGHTSDTDAITIASDGDVTFSQDVVVSGNLTITGTTTQVNTVTMNAQNAVVFEGATADAHETTLTIVDPTADRTINLPNVSGTVPVLAAASNTAITSTPEELNILDGVTSTAAELNIMDGDNSATSTTVVSGDRLILNDGGTMKQISATDLQTFINSGSASPNLVSTGALNAGSITSGFGSIDVGSDSITTSGLLTYGTLNDGSTSLTATIAELNIMDGDTSASSTTVVDADRVIVNDNGTMKQVAVTDLAAYFDDEITAMGNLVETGALNAGTITSGFGTIDIGSSAFTTTGTGTIGTLVASSLFKMPDNTSTKFLVADGTSYQEVAMSGDATLANTGALTIAATAIEGSMLNANVISGQTALASGVADTDELLISDGGTLKRVDVSVLRTAMGDASTDDATALAIALG
jgi:hypothetical protein